MSDPAPSRLQTAWVAVALASLFLYPLASTLEGDRYYLHWQSSHSTETIAALLLLGAAAFGALSFVNHLSGRAGASALLLVCAIPLASLGAGVARQLPLRFALIDLWQQGGTAFGATAVVLLLTISALILRPAPFRRWLWRLLLVLSPISLIVVKAVIVAGLREAPADQVRGAAEPGPGAGCSPVLALLFDELSFAYVYDGGEIREGLPNLRRFAAAATHHLDVTAPGPDTLVSIPGYLAARSIVGIEVTGSTVLEVTKTGERMPFDARSDSGLFARARQLGFRTEVAGYYFAYCELLGVGADACRAFSFYNRSTFESGWSPLNPILTTVILWPRQFPLGLLKNRAFAVQQRRIVEGTADFARRPIDAGLFRFVHFSIPHLPFVFDAGGYHPPADPLRTDPDTGYLNQLRYTDRLLGEILEKLRREGTFDGATIVLLSDHGFRFGGRDGSPRHVPFLVKHPGQNTRVDVGEHERAEELLPQVLSTACGG